MLINTLRPISVRKIGLGTAVPSGTLSSVTSDNSDLTYIRSLVSNANTPNRNWSLWLEPHTSPAGYQRHAIRGRIRASSDTGTVVDDIDIGRSTSDYLASASRVPITAGFAEYTSNWFQSPSFSLADPGTITNLSIGGGYAYDDGPITVTGTEVRTSECYVDLDLRFHPDYSPQVQDNAGVDKSGSTVTDTNQPLLYFGVVGYDDLPALDWSVTLRQGATVLQSSAGSGVPPAQIEVLDPLPNGAYAVDFVVRSTIRGADPFPWEVTRTFSVDNVSPPPSPPLVTVIEQNGGYLVSWEYAGGQPWDGNYVVTEVYRDDCTGSQRIATVPDAMTGSYLDLAIPQLDPQPTGPDCTDEAEPCDITYRVRYWGYVSSTIEVPDTIPDGLILAWPGTAASIPSGWSRVTALDSRYPRGATTTAAPSATGGAASHTHSAPAHTHTFGPHSHPMTGQTNPLLTGTTTDSADSGYQISRAIHTHGYPDQTGITPGGPSGSATPGTSTVNNVPPTREVIWIQSAGAQVAFPVGVLGFSTESISGWTPDAASAGRYLRGAAAAGNGGASNGAATHNHTVNAHTHTGINHIHSSAPSGLSGDISNVDGLAGDRAGEFVPRHTHPITVVSASNGGLNSASGGTTGTVSLEPPNRRLRVLRNTAGQIQTRIIGLYVGAVADLNATLTLCNGSNGTPDMRTWFARETGGASVNSTGGTSTHQHTAANHTHVVPAHNHPLTIGPSTTAKRNTKSGTFQVSVPLAAHTHTSPPTHSVSAPATASGAGNTTNVSHLPLFREVHFVRLDGIVSGGPLPVPEQRVTEFSSVTVPAFTYADGLDRIATLDTKLAVATDRSHDYPRLVADSIPINGGLHTVATQLGGEDMPLSIAVAGKREIDALERVLSADLVYFSPLGGTPGWYAPAGWSTANPSPNVWVVGVTLTRQPWPETAEPGDYL